MFQSLNAVQKSKLVGSHPCFSQFSTEELNAFVQGLDELKVHPDKAVVTQGEIVDSLYFIAQGSAEVYAQDSEQVESDAKLVGLLNAGEAIGLNESGFYSTSGMRTATVKPITPMILLSCPVGYLSEFLGSRPHLNPHLSQSAEELWQIQLIKRATPFAKMSMAGLRLLAKEVKDRAVKKGEVLFKKGDEGDFCYLIKEGQIEIYVESPEGEKQIAVLQASHLFGEAALLLNLPRTACARALDDCHLLALSKESIKIAPTLEGKAAKSLQTLIRLRARPERVSHIELETQTNAEQETIYTLKNPKQNTYYRLQEEGLFIWQRLDGTRTLRDLAIEFHNETEIFSPSMITSFIISLERGGFVEGVSAVVAQSDEAQSKLTIALNTVKKVMEFKIAFTNIDGWMTWTYNKFVKYFYTKWSLLCMAFISFSGLVAFIAKFSAHKELFRITPNSSWLMAAASWGMLSTIVLHELAHGYTTKAAGRKVSGFGVGWFWLGPIAFCDTSDMWLANKKHRLAVDLGGLGIDMLIAGMASLAALFITDPLTQIFLWLFALEGYLIVFLNLSPVLEYDGYYALIDILDVNNLREKAALWLLTDYWSLCVFFIVATILMKYMIVNVVLVGVLGKKGNPLWGYFLTLLAVFMPLFSVWNGVRQKIKKARAE